MHSNKTGAPHKAVGKLRKAQKMADTKLKAYESTAAATMKMRPSRVLRQVRAGKVASCFKLNFYDSRLAEVAAMCGVDCIWLCGEHTPSDAIQLEHQVRAAKLHDTDTLVRVPRGSYTDHIRGFEMDGTGLMVPHVMSLEDAKNVVRMTKFPPVGRRAVDGGNADGGYTHVNFLDYLETANRERFVCLQIEDPEVLPDLEAIAELPGYEMLFFGAGDFSVAIGKPGELYAPEVSKVRERIAELARKNGKMAGAVAGVDKLREFADMGYNFINSGADVFAVSEYVKRVAAGFAAL